MSLFNFVVCFFLCISCMYLLQGTKMLMVFINHGEMRGGRCQCVELCWYSGGPVNVLFCFVFLSVFMLFVYVSTSGYQNVNGIYKSWWKVGKKRANMLNCVATMAGQEQFYFFLLLLNNGYRVFSYHGDDKGPISRDSWGLSVYIYIYIKRTFF